MKSRQQRRGSEEGQVYPALILAVMGSLALAVLFVVIQNLLDQTGRSDTAADSAALAAAREHRDQLEGVMQGQGLGPVLDLLSGFGQASGVAEAAEEYAESNGATVTDFRYEGFDLAEHRWTYFVETQQQDKVEDASGDTAQTKSKARASVTLAGGLCESDGIPGIEVDGECITPDKFTEKCEEPEPPKDPKPSKGPKPTESPEPEFTPAPFCDGLGDLLDFRVELVSAS